jgi:hypothetical protein
MEEPGVEKKWGNASLFCAEIINHFRSKRAADWNQIFN